MGPEVSLLTTTPVIHSVAKSVSELVPCFILTPAEVWRLNAHVVRRSVSALTKAFDGNTTVQALRKVKKLRSSPTPSQPPTGGTGIAPKKLRFDYFRCAIWSGELGMLRVLGILHKEEIYDHPVQHNVCTSSQIEQTPPSLYADTAVPQYIPTAPVFLAGHQLERQASGAIAQVSL